MTSLNGPFQLLLFLFAQALIGSALTLEEESEPTYHTAGVGEYVVFNCDLDFPHEIPIPYSLHWIREGRTIFEWFDGESTAYDEYEGRVSLVEAEDEERGYGGASVNLTNIRESDQAWYYCKVFFLNRTPSSRKNGTYHHLSIDGALPSGNTASSGVAGETLLVVPPVNRTVLEGEPASFHCATKDASNVVTWFHNGVEMSELEELRKRASVDNEGSLRIEPTVMSDLGKYSCVVGNVHGDRQNASAFLNVQYKAKVMYAPREAYFSYGKQAVLDCHFRANPPLTDLRWEKDGFLFDPYNVQGVFYRKNGSLYFSRVDETHAGSYTCTPYNMLGTSGPGPSTTVIVQRPPVFTVTPQHLYMSKLGETLEIPCDARDGNEQHRPAITWFKDGTPVHVAGTGAGGDTRTRMRGGNLTIDKIQEQDRGLYQCAATNGAATVVADAELMVLNVPPRAPYNLSANSTDNTVTLTWIPGYVRPKMEYSIWYKPTDTTEWRTIKIVSRKITEATINNLSPGREYEFMVLSQDKHGDGMFSKAVRVFTESEAPQQHQQQQPHGPHESGYAGPPSPPTNIRVQPTAEGYLVTWDPPAVGKDQVKSYEIKWYRGPIEHLYGRAETTDTYYLLKNLHEESYYTFQVSATSLADQVTTSSLYSLELTPYRRSRAISMGIMVAIGFLVAAIAAVWWAKKKFCRTDVGDK